MASASRDRVSIDLRGIGDAVRTAAAARGDTLAAFARQALVDAAGQTSSAADVPAAPIEVKPPIVKLSLRLRESDAELLVMNAAALGLSYGDYVARLVNRTPLPLPAAHRAADRLALLASTDQLATISTDLNAFMRLLMRAQSAQIETYRQRIHSVDTDIRRHLDRASAFIADQ